MRYRQLTSTGDYTFGQGSLNYVEKQDAVSQAVKTRLKLLLGEWWEDLEDGLPLFQVILLQRGHEEGKQTIDLLVQERILDTSYVTGISSFQSEVRERSYQAEAIIDTEFGQIVEATVLEVGG